MVKALAMVGAPHTRIAETVGIDIGTLGKHYEPELRTGEMHMLAKAGGNMWNLMGSKKEEVQLRSSQYVLSTKGKDYGWTHRIDFALQRDLFAGLDLSKLNQKDLADLHRILVKAGAPIDPSDLPVRAVPALPAPGNA